VKEFYENCKKCSGSGIVVFNLIITTESSFKLIMNMMLSVFNNRCLCLTVPDYKNIIILAFTENVAIETDVTVLRTKCEILRNRFNFEFDDLLDEIISTNVCLDNKLQF